MRHAAGQGKIIEYGPIAGNMPHGNGHTSHNMHATHLVYISKYCHCHCESIDMQTMHIKEAIDFFMRHAAGQGKIIEVDPIASNMPHKNSHQSININAIDINRFTMTVAIF